MLLKKYCIIVLILLLGYTSILAQELDKLGTATYIELLGKGFISANVDLPIGPKDRISLGLTMLDHEFAKEENEKNYPILTLPTPSVMYLHLFGQECHYFEAGLGVSVSPVFWKEYSVHDSPLSLHGCLGYRYQTTNHFFFRAGVTPFYRINWAFLPLVGISAGYSW